MISMVQKEFIQNKKKRTLGQKEINAKRILLKSDINLKLDLILLIENDKDILIKQRKLDPDYNKDFLLKFSKRNVHNRYLKN